MTQEVQPLVVGVREAAAMLNVSPAQIYKMIGEGKIPCTQIGRDYKIARSTVYKLAGISQETLPDNIA